ncbi:MAG: sugar ABC transporter ATP-binding protein, partial [Verrucomicrobia bacterium]|nr:sugar ABC transporter ATP-binding protein [Verrucomicrobiota bacterium]
GLRTQGVAVVYITHRLEEVFALADRVTVLRDGESVATRVLRSAAGAPGAPLTEAELIRCMVGREIAQLYPEAGAAPGPVVLSLRGLGCSASGVREISLDLRAGEILGLAGLVGAGRTELAHLLFGITPADAGQILLDGRRLAIRSPGEAVAQGIAYVPEDRRQHGVVLELPVAHNMSLACHPRLFPSGWIRPTAEALLADGFIRDLGIRTDGPLAPAGTLSGGNQQKVALARWLATHPRVLILDEPTQGVDIGAKAEIHRLMRQLANEGLAILMISSDLPEVLGMSDRIGVMRGGALVTLLSRGATASQVMTAALGRPPESREAA